MGERRGTKALELWCKRMTDGYPGVKIDNMTTSWRDGLAFCAMIHHFRPELIDFDKLNKNDVYFNNDLAFRTAETHLGIPALLDADDMATYEVPDRLSILTYLSQFYQVFAAQAQESHNRLKRTSAAAEKTQISKTQGPPPKMAHVVGVPKRDPCQKCSLPVFLAERLTFGKHVYHRTCLKCARCHAQLTLGSFYETEIDGEYCCETCPDEEEMSTVQQTINKNQTDDDPIGAVAINPSHSSIADRLAFFETIKESGNALLQKSVSDEEKRQSLNKINETTSTPYKMNSALSSFMSSTITDEEVHDGITTIENITNTSSSPITSDNDDEDLNKLSPPKLPKTLPPQQLPLESQSDIDSMDYDKNISDIDIKIDDEKQQPLDAQSPRLSPVNTQIVNNEIKPIIPNKNKIDTDIKNADTDAINTNNKITSDQPLSEQEEEEEQKISRNNYRTSCVLSLTSSPARNDLKSNENENKNNDNNIVTKDTSENDETTRTKINEIDEVILREGPIENDTCQSSSIATVDDNYGIDKVTTNRLSVVRARLHQFEVITNNASDNNLNKNNNINNNNNDNKSSLSGNSSSNCKIDSPKISYENKENINLSNAIEKDLIVEQNPSNEIPETNEIFVEASAIIDDKVPKINESSDLSNFNDKINVSFDNNKDENELESNVVINAPDEDKIEQSSISKTDIINKTDINYPDDLNPFNDEEENNEDEIDENKIEETVKTSVVPAPRKSVPENVTPSKSPTGAANDLNRSLNPFDSSDDEIELNKKVKPPRPPPPKNISKNPFGSDTDDADETESASNISKNVSKRIPVPTPRIITTSQTPTPEPTPRMSTKQFNATTPLNNAGEYYGSSASLSSPYPSSLRRDSDARGSNNSLTSSNGTIRSRKSKKAPAPPPPSSTSVKELFPSPETANSSRKSTPNSSTSTTPSQQRKKRPAPAPPKPARLDPNASLTNSDIGSKNLDSYPLQSNIDKLSDEEKALLEGKVFSLEDQNKDLNQDQLSDDNDGTKNRRIIPLDTRILDDVSQLSDIQQTEQNNVVYRRKIFASPINSPIDTEKSIVSHDRQLQKLKDNKEAQNRNRQSQVSLGVNDDVDPLFNNKSSHGKWKRRKGPAPSLPIPPRKILQMLPLQEIRYELDIIEVQQQGLEKQGVILEQMIRDRCEGKNGELDADGSGSNSTPNSKEVEDLILQLFELVNEKNELFRRQAELMYLRRQHRLEQEQADLEYEIRVLMAQPERNKTDTDKAREEALIARMVEVVQLRNEVIECLEMDRLREAEEDLSIKQRLELHTARRENEPSCDNLSKLSKKEKKKQKETKKLFKSKKLDADKDDDESELNVDKLKNKKKKKKFLLI